MDTGRLAYTYAWWLTGDERAAVHAVRVAAAQRAGAPAAAFAAVRRTAIRERTMCPGSEIALLHDVHGLALPEAARLVQVDPDDARAELAHGRLEALVDGAGEAFRHPERLGGLAAGNPPDVAHARQCADCGRARTLLERGREALRALPGVPVPAALEPPTAPALRARAGAAVAVAALLFGIALTLLAGLGERAAPTAGGDGHAADRPARRSALEAAPPAEPLGMDAGAVGLAPQPATTGR